MIAVTRLDGASILLNADVVEWIEQTPDTLIGLLNGERVLVRESPDELVRRIVAFKQSVIAGPAVRRTSAALENHG